MRIPGSGSGPDPHRFDADPKQCYPWGGGVNISLKVVGKISWKKKGENVKKLKQEKKGYTVPDSVSEVVEEAPPRDELSDDVEGRLPILHTPSF